MPSKSSTTLASNLPGHFPRHSTKGPDTSSKIRNVVVGGYRTSIRMEPTMWSALQDVARYRGLSVNDLVTWISTNKESGSSLTAAVRVYLVQFYRNELNTVNSTGLDAPPVPERRLDLSVAARQVVASGAPSSAAPKARQLQGDGSSPQESAALGEL
jgi:predicted DNA-binding ribbon-helix-helix protein